MNFQEGPHYKAEDLIFYALGGCICIEDLVDGTITFCTPNEFKLRAKNLHREAERIYVMPDPYRRRLADQHKALTHAVGCMADCYKDAKDQGDPMDPRVLAQLRRERRKASMVI